MSFGLTYSIPEFRGLAREGAEYEFAPKVLIEGDSWFAYPSSWVAGVGKPQNIVKLLRRKTAGKWLLCKLSQSGDELREIFDYDPLAHADEPEDERKRIFRKSHSGFLVQAVANNDFDFLLLSAGGNDIAHKECSSANGAHPEGFLRFLRPGVGVEASAEELLKREVVDREFESMAEHLFAFVHEALLQRMNESMKIVIHNYALPYPDGRPFKVAGDPKVGPWFKCAFEERKTPEVLRREILGVLLRAWSKKLSEVRGRLPTELKSDFVIVDTYTATDLEHSEWANELHPNNQGFEKVFDVIWKELERLAKSI